MHRRTALFSALAFPFATASRAAAPAPLEDFVFASIDGGDLNLGDWRGDAILVVNTASQCGFTDQYAGLQTLHERYGDQGLRVLAVPSDAFRQELDSAAEVKDFCETTFGLTLPMTDITPVRGRTAHPFYLWMAEAHRFQPRWNFNKVLLGRTGDVIGTFGSMTAPLSRDMVSAIERALSS